MRINTRSRNLSDVSFYGAFADTIAWLSETFARFYLSTMLTPLRYSDLNRLLMDYLVVEGYTEAADCFARESGQPAVDLQSIEHRMAIRAAVQRGDVENAIERVNDLNPEVRCLASGIDLARIMIFMHHSEHEPRSSDAAGST